MKRSGQCLSLSIVLASALVAACSAPSGQEAEDTPRSLSSALCSSVSIVSDDADYTGAPGQLVTWTATPGSCAASPEYRFNTRDPSGAWLPVQDWSSSPSFAWDTTGHATGAWYMQVWIRDANTGSLNYDNYSGKDYTLSSSPACASVSTTTTPSSVVAGQTVTVASTASPCTLPEYEIHHYAPGVGWSTLKSYSSAASYAWNTTGEPAGTHYLQVWTRVQGSFNQYEVLSTNAVNITSASACTGVSTTASPSTVSVGGTVTVSSSASSCPLPEYEIHHYAPGVGWSTLKPYSSASSYAWNTTGEPAGTHYLQVWTRQQGTFNQYDVLSTTAVNVKPSQPCTGVTFVESPPVHASVGTQVSITATATGCASPRYRFLYQNPSGTFVEIQPFTASNTALWNTALAPAGAYSLQVIARASDSVSDDAYRFDAYTLDAAASSSLLAVTGGWAHECVIQPSGKVACWGYDAYGNIGNGVVGQSIASPSTPTGVTQAISLTTGYNHTCAVLFGGSVKCWGTDLHGQLGDGTNNNAASPVSVSGISNAVQVGAGNAHTCATLADGSVKCWGYNSQGQLGNGFRFDSSVPVTVTGISTAVAVSGGYYYSCAILKDTTVRCWGFNGAGQLGNGTTTSSLNPVTVTGLSGVTAISSSNDNNCALKADGTIWCWGGNSSYGNLGTGNTSPATSPVQVPNVTTATSVSLSANHGCASLANGTAICWGFNNYGQLGNGLNVDSLAAVPVSNLTNVKSVGVADLTSCATLTDNTVSCWGYGSLGSLGNAAYASSNVPVATAAIP